MKIVAIIILSLFSYQSYAACKCNCNPYDKRICASYYELDHPCPAARCPHQSARTACLTQRVFNQYKGVYEWRAYCPELNW